MPSLGIGELLLIGIVLLVVVGPERLPHATRWLGRAYAQLRRAANELQRALVLEADRMDEEDRLRELRKRREEALERAREKAEEQTPRETGEPIAQPETLMTGVSPEPDPAPSTGVPPGFSEDEWAELPEHVREIVRRRGQESA